LVNPNGRLTVDAEERAVRLKNLKLELDANSLKDMIPLRAVRREDMKSLSAKEARWAEGNGFDGASGTYLTVPGTDGAVSHILVGVGNEPDPMGLGQLARKLPPAHYRLERNFGDLHLAYLSWALGAYDFDRYRSVEKKEASSQLLADVSSVDPERLKREIASTFLARDLINTPANDMGPKALEQAIRDLADAHGGEVQVTRGDELLEENFPMIHAVGRAASQAPRLVDLVWGDPTHKKVTLVGKGVSFDTGGLNIKPGNSMALMKKDMGGAANTIALANMIMDAKLPLRLRLLVPAVENSISASAFRPGDVLQSRKGLSVEIGNTDAEGRLILADALALADEEAPDLLIDMATLTGAARVALGPDLPPFYTAHHGFADKLTKIASENRDPVWRMPLWQPYGKMLSSKIADINHITKGGFAGSLTAALFLERFVENAKIWCHLDIFGWVPEAKPWAPVGGEAQGIRALYSLIEQDFS